MVTTLNSLGTADGREDVLIVDEHLIKDASHEGDDFCVPYENPSINISEDGRDWFSAFVAKQVGSLRAGSCR